MPAGAFRRSERGGGSPENGVGSRDARSPTRTARLTVGAWEPAVVTCVRVCFPLDVFAQLYSTTEKNNGKTKINDTARRRSNTKEITAGTKGSRANVANNVC